YDGELVVEVSELVVRTSEPTPDGGEEVFDFEVDELTLDSDEDEDGLAKANNRWAGRFVAICASSHGDKLAQPPAREGHPRSGVAEKDKSKVREAALEQLKHRGPRDEGWYKRLFSNRARLRAGRPVLV